MRNQICEIGYQVLDFAKTVSYSVVAQTLVSAAPRLVSALVFEPRRTSARATSAEYVTELLKPCTSTYLHKSAYFGLGAV